MRKNEEGTMLVAVIIFLIVTVGIFYLASLTSKASSSNVEFYSYGIKETKVDYILKDNRIFVNLKNNLIPMKTEINIFDNLMSCEKTRNNTKYKLVFGKKSSSIFYFENENKYSVTMDYIPQKVKFRYYVQLTKLCDALDLKWKYSNKKGIQKFEIEEGGW